MPAIFDGTNGLTFNDNTRMGSAQFSNRLINPNFTINQRAATGTVVLAAGAYGFDRWKAGASGCTFTFTVSANVTTLTISAGTLMQVIEGANLQSGVHVLSWTGSALGRIDAGSYSASGVTGTASGGTNQTIEFAAGTLVMPRYNQGAASSVQFLPIGLELALCQRYLYDPLGGDITTPNLAIAPAFTETASDYYCNIKFPVQMRVAPSIVGLTAGNFALGYPANFAISSLNIQIATRESVLISGGMATAVANKTYQLYRPGSSAHMLFNAEL